MKMKFNLREAFLKAVTVSKDNLRTEPKEKQEVGRWAGAGPGTGEQKERQTSQDNPSERRAARKCERDHNGTMFP